MKKISISILLILFLFTSQIWAGGKWYNNYKDGLKAMKRGNWAQAITFFKEALKVKSTDRKKIKTYGMHFIEYFPHREIGICFYNLGHNDKAKQELNISLSQQYSARAQEYLSNLSGIPTIKQPITAPPKKDDLIKTPPTKISPPTKLPPAPTGDIKLVGERMGLAILPFQTKGLGVEMGEINIVEQMMTNFYTLNRFKLFERSQLEKILEEQKLGMTGILDASTAAEIGKGIGVDAIALGSVTRSGGNIAIDARLIDTETAEIITAQDEMSTRTSIRELKEMIRRLTLKISKDLPLVEGYVINVEGDQLTLDIGLNKNVKKGMKCVVYREGQDIIHPIKKTVLGKQTEVLGEVKLIQVYPQYSIGKVIKSEMGMFEIGNKVVTK